MGTFTDADQNNGVKAATHGALCALAGMCLVYNIAAWLRRRQQHSVVNAVVYAGLVAFEVMQVAHHAEHRRT